MSKKNNRIGRPTKFKFWMCERVIELMSMGASKTEVAADIDISWDTMAAWQKENPLFSEAIKAGELKSHAWWEEHARKNLHNKEFNSTLWYMNMKNRFGWRDRQDITSENEKVGTVLYIPKEEK